ncbi:MAG: hypothetical protein U0795_05375 [Pirellulales bacterium]
MTPHSSARWATPSFDQLYLLDPVWSEWLRAGKWQPISAQPSGLLGSATDLVAWRAAARAEVAELIRSRSHANPPEHLVQSPATADSRWIVAGHQPQLFHPGVWFKNFVLSRLGQETQSLALNVVIDNDLCRSAAIRVPAGDHWAPRIEHVAFDESDQPLPYEERRIRNRQIWCSLPKRVAEVLPTGYGEPLLESWWPEVDRLAEHEPNLGNCLARGRHQLERHWGLTHVELLMSDLCRLPSFARFAALLVWHAEQVRRSYNAALADYRRDHRVRSSAHPAPDLQQHAPWCEIPLWIWSRDCPLRKPAWARSDGTDLIVGDGGELSLRFSARSLDEFTHAWHAAAQGSVRLRPRALVTTLFLRTWLSDQFLHGIGGAKYDLVTDRLIQELFGVAPPAYGAASASVRLPLDLPLGAGSRSRELQQRLRELVYQPERFMTEEALRQPDVSAAVARKELEMKRQLPAGLERRLRHATLVDCNQRLQPWVAGELAAAREELNRLQPDVRRCQLWGSRDFAFCLYPATTLPAAFEEAIRDAQSDNDR